MDQRNAIGRAFNGMTVLVGYEIPLRRIGAGLFPANANFQQSPFSDTSAADNRVAFEGVRDVYFGSGFDALLAGIDPGLAAEVDAAFDRAERRARRARRALCALSRPARRQPRAGGRRGGRACAHRSRTRACARPETGSACWSSSPGSDAANATTAAKPDARPEDFPVRTIRPGS